MHLGHYFLCGFSSLVALSKKCVSHDTHTGLVSRIRIYNLLWLSAMKTIVWFCVCPFSKVHGAWLPPWLVTYSARYAVRWNHRICTSAIFVLTLISMIINLCRRWSQATGMNMENLPWRAFCRRYLLMKQLIKLQLVNYRMWCLKEVVIYTFLPCQIASGIRKISTSKEMGWTTCWDC
jgi:hypothetical protein